VEHNDNVALALAVCSHFGVDRETALKGMHQAFPDAGAMKIYKIQSEQGALYFINALAANDPDSTMEIWRKIEDYYPQWNHLTVLLNARSDRYDRSVQLMEMCANGLRFHQLALIGQRLEQVVGIADRARIPRDKLIVIKNSEPEVVYRRIKESIPLDGLSLIFAIGNMGAGGLQVANYFEKMSETENIELQ
jgi:poly-gamma-glutamate synthase PgsB/CapB